MLKKGKKIIGFNKWSFGWIYITTETKKCKNNSISILAFQDILADLRNEFAMMLSWTKTQILSDNHLPGGSSGKTTSKILNVKSSIS